MCKGYCLQRVPGIAQAQSVQRWAFILAMLVALIFPADRAAAQADHFSFDIAAQPLATALEQYGAVTGRNVLYNSNLATGRLSNGAKGSLSADAALASLLENTGLSAQRMTADAFVLSMTASERAVPVSPDVADYFGRIQIRLQMALCRDSLARPGNYRIAMRFRVDERGVVTKYEQFGSAGNTTVDEAIHDAVSRLRIGATPPAGSGQPIVIVILPQAPGLTMGCDGASPLAQTAR